MDIVRFVFSPIEVNTYLLSDNSGKCAVIDCGCYEKAEFDRLSGFLDNKSLEPALLLNTHCHLDHIFGNKMFLEKYNIGTYCHGNEEANRRDSIILADILGLKMEIPPEPEGLLKDEEIVTFGKTELKVLFVPGHSSGSLAFYCEKEGVVFTGDALFAGSIGRTDLSGGNYDMLIHSIKTKLFILPPATIVYPGHGESTTIEKEIKTNPYFN